MAAGRPRKPTNMHVLRGTFRKDRHAGDEPQPPPAGLEPPGWLKAAGKRVWEELAPRVRAEGLLTEMDVELFAHACSQLAVARRSAKEVKALDIANRILARFGFTPSDRAKVRVAPKAMDGFDDFLKRAK